jgi:L-ascorbate metabolism protein UlaG (beta-lactamase superfamily)
VKLRIRYRDETPFGSAVAGRCDETIRAVCAPVVEMRHRDGLVAVVERAAELLARCDLGALYRAKGQLREDVLYPPSTLVTPEAMLIEIADDVCTVPLTSALTHELASWIGDWSRGASPPAAGPARALWDELDAIGALCAATEPSPSRATATFVGHATVALPGDERTLIVDPMFHARNATYGAYQPVALAELGRELVVLITHGHPDHFDLGDLLRVGAHTPIVVPAVARESILAIDMAARLRQLGFRDVREMAWFDQARIGEFSITALPFYGEQPTWGERYHPEARNQGNLYLVERAGLRFLFTADAGADRDGDVRTMSYASRARFGAADVVFGGHRGFGVFPVQYVFSTVARYLPFVPPASWNVRQRCMADEHELLDMVEIWGARVVVPYAVGGAPWHWDHGLGPDATNADNTSPLDPPPERLVEAAAHRSGVRGLWLPSSSQVMVLRPGDALAFRDDAFEAVRENPHAWPYG